MNIAFTILVILILAVMGIYIVTNHFEEDRLPKPFELVGYILTSFLALIIFFEMAIPAYVRTNIFNKHFEDLKSEEVELVAIFENADNYEYHFNIRGISNAAMVTVEKTTNKRDIECIPSVTYRYIDSDGGIIISNSMSDEIKDILSSRIEQSH